MSKLKPVNIKELLDAGVHFGHKTSRWNPKMAPYIYGIKDNIHVIDLQQTVFLMQSALHVIYETAKNNGKILFVGTKIQARDIVDKYAEQCGQYYINHRWRGGMLTNWKTVSRSIKKLDNLEKILENKEEYSVYTKNELLGITRQKDKLLKSFGGIRHIETKPDLLIVIDTNKEHLAMEEALKLAIPIVAIVDTNSNPDNVDHPIPGNDDAIRSIRLYCNLFAEAALVGIEEALATSGVDLGSVVDHKTKEETIQGVSKLQPIKKFSKTLNITTTLTTALEEALEVKEQVKSSQDIRIVQTIKVKEEK